MNDNMELDLIGGKCISIDGIGTLKPPKLSDLRQDGGIGWMRYAQYLTTLTMKIDNLFEAIGLNYLSAEQRSGITQFKLLTSIQQCRELLDEALSFFMLETLVYDGKSGSFAVLNQDQQLIGVVSEETFPRLKKVILRACFIEDDDPYLPQPNEGKRKSDIRDKLRAGREQMKASKAKEGANKDMEISNVISAVSARHPSYNLLNIWELTVFQLYDQFKRVNTNNQLDVVATKWAAWGSDPFDFSMWYKNLN
jgi:hypothetical protein